MDCIALGMLAQADWFALFDITVPRTSPRWFDADGDKLACLLGGVGGESERFLKSCFVGNHVICRQHGHDCRVVASCHPACSEGDCSSGIAFRRLGYDVGLWKIRQ